MLNMNFYLLYEKLNLIHIKFSLEHIFHYQMHFLMIPH